MPILKSSSRVTLNNSAGPSRFKQLCIVNRLRSAPSSAVSAWYRASWSAELGDSRVHSWVDKRDLFLSPVRSRLLSLTGHNIECELCNGWWLIGLQASQSCARSGIWFYIYWDNLEDFLTLRSKRHWLYVFGRFIVDNLFYGLLLPRMKYFIFQVNIALATFVVFLIQ